MAPAGCSSWGPFNFLPNPNEDTMSKHKTFSHHVFHNPDSDAFPFFCDGYALPGRKANNTCIICGEVVDRVYVGAQTIRIECPELSDSIVAFNDFRNRRVSCPTSMYSELLDSFEKYGYFYDENQYSFWRYPKCKVSIARSIPPKG